MTRRQLLHRLQTRFPSMQIDELRHVLDVFFGTITDNLKRGNRVELRGFGSFNVKIRSPRRARNPRSGETIMTSVTAQVQFRGGKRLHESLNPHLIDSHAVANQNEDA